MSPSAISPFELLVPQFKKELFNLSMFLKKAQTYADLKKFDSSVLMTSRLAPDQFPLARQLQICCDTAKLTVSRLTGKQAPAHEDNEKTFGEVQTRIESVISYLNSVTETDFSKFDSTVVTTPWWNGKSLDAKPYLIQYAIPNFYFHVTTAYAILRHNGIDLGKNDFLGELPFRS